MTDRKTLKLGEATEAPALKKRGRGWEISDKRLDNLHDQARHMRRHSSAAHKVLAARFAKADLGRYKFTRHAVVGSAIVDFNCHNLGMAIAIDEEGADETLARRRDKSLESVGVRVMRIAAADILANIDMTFDEFIAVCDRFTNKRLFVTDRHGELVRGADHHLTKINDDNPE